MMKEGEIKQATFPSHKYEEMIAFPKNHSKLTEWIGVYSVYVKKAAWRMVSIKSMQTDNITFPFNVYVSEIEFDTDGVATITSENKSDSTTWYINCWPEEIKKKDVDKRFIHCHDEDDPFYIDHNLNKIIPKSVINASKAENLSGAPPDCQLIVKGIRPPTQVDLSTSCFGNLTLVGTITSQSNNIKTGPVAISSETIHTGLSLHHTSTHLYHSSILQQEPEMADLNKIVIPRIKAEWEDVAYALRYKIVTVNAIKDKHHENPKKCCRELFIDWLSTNHGVSPKIWSTLLDKLKEVEDLSAATQEIINELEKTSSFV